MYNLLVGGTYKSFGLLFVEFNHIFPDDGPARVGLIGLTFGLCSLFMGMYYYIGLLVNFEREGAHFFPPPLGMSISYKRSFVHITIHYSK